MKINYTKEEKKQVAKELKSMLKRCSNKVYGVVRNVSQSGMSRDIYFFGLLPFSYFLEINS